MSNKQILHQAIERLEDELKNESKVLIQAGIIHAQTVIRTMINEILIEENKELEKGK